MISQDYLETMGFVGKTNTNKFSIVASIYPVGCAVGAIVAFTIGEQLGRKKCILIGTSIMTVGAILQTSSFSFAQMLVGRIVTGWVRAGSTM